MSRYRTLPDQHNEKDTAPETILKLFIVIRDSNS
jgi:hypothetical protein